MKKTNPELNKIIELYQSIKKSIIQRLGEFKIKFDKGSDYDIFCELVFCILTPQSSAIVCWDAVKRLMSNDLILKGEKEKLSLFINPVRFKNNKASYIVNARKLFLDDNSLNIKSKIMNFKDNMDAREWLVGNVKGISYKESSHFLRNIGFGDNLAILDRHILKNLVLLGVIEEIPKTINKPKYLEIEKKIKNFANKINIDIMHLDFVLWYKETNKIFK
jgi:N-glycosylase/DNA lyase